MQSLMGCEEESGFDITTLNALAVTVTIVTTILQMKKIRLREVYSLIQQTFIEHLLCVRCYTGCWRNSCEQGAFTRTSEKGRMGTWVCMSQRLCCLPMSQLPGPSTGVKGDHCPPLQVLRVWGPNALLLWFVHLCQTQRLSPLKMSQPHPKSPKKKTETEEQGCGPGPESGTGNLHRLSAVKANLDTASPGQSHFHFCGLKIDSLLLLFFKRWKLFPLLLALDCPCDLLGPMPSMWYK